MPVRSGPLALAQVFAPYLYLPLLLGVPIALLSAGTAPERRARSALRLGLAVCAVVALVRFGTIWVSLPASAAPDSTRMGVTSWNLELGEADPAVVVEALRTAEPGVIGLEELTPRHAGRSPRTGHQGALPVRPDVPQGRLARPRPPQQHSHSGWVLGRHRPAAPLGPG